MSYEGTQRIVPYNLKAPPLALFGNFTNEGKKAQNYLCLGVDENIRGN